jgi:cytochrome P450
MRADEIVLPSWRPDPYPLYEALRAEGPVHFSERLDAWVLTRHADIAAALRDPRLSSKRGVSAFSSVPPALQTEMAPFKGSLKLWTLFRDPPDHTRVRALVSKAFAPRLVDAMRPKIEGIVEELLAAPLARGDLEVVSELARPLPAIVIAEMVGVPREARDQFTGWSDDLATLLVPGVKTTEMTEQALKSWQEMDRYLADLAAQRRSDPRDDLLTALLSAEEQGSLLSEDEVRATVGLLLFAGHETTTNLISLGVLTLLRHPDALAALRADPDLIPTAVEEMLRYESPVQLITRLVNEDLTIGGQTMRKGQGIILLLASANRDPEQFQQPDRFVINRRENRHLSLGLGIHFCLGSALARAEAQITFRLLLERCPGLRLTEEPADWRDSLAFRCPQRLSVVA